MTFHVFRGDRSIATAGSRKLAFQIATSAAIDTFRGCKRAAVSVRHKEIGNGTWKTDAVIQERCK